MYMYIANISVFPLLYDINNLKLSILYNLEKLVKDDSCIKEAYHADNFHFAETKLTVAITEIHTYTSSW